MPHMDFKMILSFSYLKEKTSVFRLSRPRRFIKYNRTTRYVYCNAKNACGDPNFLAMICSKDACGEIPHWTYSVGYAENVGDLPNRHGWDWDNTPPYRVYQMEIRLTNLHSCYPCCILDENIHPKMKLCSEMPTSEQICQHHKQHGRCGIEFDP